MRGSQHKSFEVIIRVTKNVFDSRARCPRWRVTTARKPRRAPFAPKTGPVPSRTGAGQLFSTCGKGTNNLSKAAALAKWFFLPQLRIFQFGERFNFWVNILILGPMVSQCSVLQHQVLETTYHYSLLQNRCNQICKTWTTDRPNHPNVNPVEHLHRASIRPCISHCPLLLSVRITVERKGKHIAPIQISGISPRKFTFSNSFCFTNTTSTTKLSTEIPPAFFSGLSSSIALLCSQ